MTEDNFDLSKKIILITNSISPDFIGDKKEDMKEGTICPDEMLFKKDVKEFIQRQIKRIDNRISFLDEFEGLRETFLQKQELLGMKQDLLEDAGSKFTGDGK